MTGGGRVWARQITSGCGFVAGQKIAAGPTGASNKEGTPAMLLTEIQPSDATLMKRLKDAASRRVSKSDLRAQRVSFIASALSDGNTVVTPEMVEAELKKLDGEAA